MAIPKCIICGRRLSDPESIARETGPECANKRAAILSGAGLTFSQLNITEQIAAEPNVARWLHFAEQAALKGHNRNLEHFRQAAIQAAGYAAAGQAELAPSICESNGLIVITHQPTLEQVEQAAPRLAQVAKAIYDQATPERAAA